MSPSRARHWTIPFALLSLVLATLSGQHQDIVSIGGGRNYLKDYPTFSPGDSVNIVVEIPAGTAGKWEVNKTGDRIEWELLQDGKRRVVRYLAYPANYGMIPRTLLPRSEGGDGDPLDVVLVGKQVERGKVVAGRPVGVLRLIDSGERDDKIILVPLEAPWLQVQDLADLELHFPGATRILETWFTNYKGPGVVVSKGFQGALDSRAMIRKAARSYEEANRAK